MSRLHLLLLAALFVAGLLASPQPACAQDNRSTEIEETREAYAEARALLEDSSGKDARALEARLRDLRDASRMRLERVNREIENVRSQLAPLGDPPGEDEPPESAELAAERAALNQDLARLNSQRTRINANIVEANDLLAKLSANRIQSLYKSLTVRGASPFSPAVLRETFDQASAIGKKIDAYFGNWSQQKLSGGAFLRALVFITGAGIISVLIFGPVNRWALSNFTTFIEQRKPTPRKRVVAAGLKMIARVVPGLIAGLIILETLRATGILNQAGAPAARAAFLSLLAYLLISGFAGSLFAARNPDWRHNHVDLTRGRQINLALIAIVVIYGVKIVLGEIFATVNAGDAILRVNGALASIFIAISLFWVCRTRLWEPARATSLRSEESDDEEEKGAQHAVEKVGDRPTLWRLTRRIGRVLAIIITLAAIIGYVDFAVFAASRLYYLALFLVIAWFVQSALMEIALWLHHREQKKENRSQGDNAEAAFENFQFWSALLVNVALCFAILPGLLVLFGVPASNMRDLAQQALFGFNIGGVKIPSVANFLVAVVTFILILALTKLAQKGFKKGLFAHSQIDSGVQNSLITLIGYAGLVVALFVSISSIGIDLSNLALIAGALSVGIGFGLQSIINNFVSGLILLFERPIKVGDWIVTASGEGTVKKISVRSTEIETFDRSSIIVPNSELISSTVTNWTHKDRIGRIKVPVGVSYNADPERVRAILLKCAEDHPLIVKYPEPFVIWQEFGASSLDFELRAYLANISDGMQTRSELRFAIFKALADAGIEIPFPQQDIHVKSVAEGLFQPKSATQDSAKGAS